MRKGKIPLTNVSGGELTSAPLLESPPKYSRLLQNFFINAEGHIAKVPGYAAISQNVADAMITSGVDFKKSDGSLILVGGRSDTGTNYNHSVYTAGGSVVPPAVFSGTGVNDITSGGTYTGSGNAVFDLKVTQVGTGASDGEWSPDLILWRKNGGDWNYWFLDINQPETKNLSDGVTVTTQTGYGHTLNDTWTITIVSPGIDDLTPTGTCTESGDTVFDVEITATGTPDTFKWRKNSGSYTTGVAITGAPQALSDGVSITFAATTGHAYGAKWQITSSPIKGTIYRLDSGNLSVVKNDFLSFAPIHFGQVGDVIIAANGVDRPVAYDGATFQNINLPFGKSTIFTGVGLDDFSANISFTYETAVYAVEIDGIAINPITPSYTGIGKNDMSVPNPNFSGNAATATYNINIDGLGAGDTIKYNVNGGSYITNQPLTILTEGLDMGAMRLKAATTIGHDSTDIYEFQVSTAGTPDKFKWRKNSGAWSAETDCKAYPTYEALDSHYGLSFESATGNAIGDIFAFQVDGATTPDTFRWCKDAGSYTNGVPIGGSNSLGNGINIAFKYFTGHTTNDAWGIAVARDTVKWSKDGTVLQSTQLITGAYQTIQAGVQFKFNAINGHTIGDLWTMPVDQSVRFGRMHPYKNRLWAIGSDKLTVYYSDLLKPTDFTGSGAGYLDFRYVIPKGDELVDIGSMMNFLVFFLKNHIIIYAGADPTAEGDFVIFQNIAGLGLLAPNTIVSVGSDIFFLTNKGIKGLKQVIATGSLNVDNISAAIDSDVIAAIDANTSGVYASAHYATLGLIMFLIGTTIFVFNYRQQAWSRIVIPSSGGNVPKILSMFESADGFVYMGGYTRLFEFDPAAPAATYNFNGVAPIYRWTSGMIRTTTADSMYFNELLLRLASTTTAATLTLKTRAVGFDTPVEDQAAFNEQTVSVPAITTNAAVLNSVRIPLFGAGKYIQVDFTETPNFADNNDIEFVGLEVHGELGIL